MCRKGCGHLFLRLKLADEVYEVDKKDPQSWRALQAELEGREFRRVFCPHESIRSALFVRKLKAFEKIGFSNWWNWFVFSKRVRRPMHLPESLRQLSLLKVVDENFAAAFAAVEHDPRFANPAEQKSVRQWPVNVPDFAELRVSPRPEDVESVRAKFLNQAKLPVFIAPGSVWATKMWTAEGFAEVGRHFVKKGHTVYFTGSPSESALCEKLVSEVPGSMNLAGKTSLVELHALFSQGQLVISNDSSPIHLAAMAGVPCVGIFGATTLSLGYRPWSNNSKVAQIEMKCRPCGLHGHKECPLGHHRCMRDLSSAEVIRLAESALLTGL